VIDPLLVLWLVNPVLAEAFMYRWRDFSEVLLQAQIARFFHPGWRTTVGEDGCAGAVGENARFIKRAAGRQFKPSACDKNPVADGARQS